MIACIIIPSDSNVLGMAVFTVFRDTNLELVFRYLFVPLTLPLTGLFSQANVTVQYSMRQINSNLCLEKTNVLTSH